MKVWTMTRTSIYGSTGEVYLVTTAHETYRGAVKSARAELEYFGEEYVGVGNKRALIDAYANGRRRAHPDGNWFDASDGDCRVVISIDELTVG